MAQGSGRKQSEGETERCRYWRKQIRSWERSGQTQAAFCRDRGLSVSAFGWWKSEFKRRKALAGCGEGKLRDSGVFVPVHVESNSVRVGNDDRLEVVLASGPVVRVPAGFDAGGLIRLLDVLESRC